MFDAENTRSILDALIVESRLYKNGKDYKALLDFIARLPHIAPFNAMLLQIQKPGLKFAMTAKDWRKRFGHCPKEGARPLVILMPFGPVGFVYDSVDTEGPVPLPNDVFSFRAKGKIDPDQLARIKSRLEANRTPWYEVDQGDAHAGLVRLVKYANGPEEVNEYRININRNHGEATQFATLAHELGHIYLGHLGADKKRKIKDRSNIHPHQKELEAESVSYLICARAQIESKPQLYLSAYVESEDPVQALDIYTIVTVCGTIEAILQYHAPRAVT